MTTTTPIEGLDLTSIGITTELRQDIAAVTRQVVALLDESELLVDQARALFAGVEPLVAAATEHLPVDEHDAATTTLDTITGMSRLFEACDVHRRLWEDTTGTATCSQTDDSAP